LPDVEVFKRYVDATLLHQKIRSVEVRNEKILGGVSAHRLQGTMKGRTFESTRRHGKYLFVRLDDDSWLLLHFGMTGSLEYFKDMDRDPPHDRLLISFENHYHLALDDARMFGKVDLIEVRTRSSGRRSWGRIPWSWKPVPSANASKREEGA